MRIPDLFDTTAFLNIYTIENGFIKTYVIAQYHTEEVFLPFFCLTLQKINDRFPKKIGKRFPT